MCLSSLTTCMTSRQPHHKVYGLYVTMWWGRRSFDNLYKISHRKQCIVGRPQDLLLVKTTWYYCHSSGSSSKWYSSYVHFVSVYVVSVSKIDKYLQDIWQFYLGHSVSLLVQYFSLSYMSISEFSICYFRSVQFY